jgi:hypothetical protein
MTKRFFSATDGQFTIFRASEDRTYSHGKLIVSTHGWDQARRCAITVPAHPVGLGFCNRPGRDTHPAIEITKAEYDRLVGLKRARIDAASGIGPDRGRHQDGGSPSDSWVRNSALEG